MDIVELPLFVLGLLLQLGYLDKPTVFIMKMVCRSWRETVIYQGHLWRELCHKEGHMINRCPVCGTVSHCHFFHNLYVLLQSARYAMGRGQAMWRGITMWPDYVPSSDAHTMVQCYMAQDSTSIVIAVPAGRRQRLLLLDVDTLAVVREMMGTVRGCLHVGGGLVLSSTPLGHLYARDQQGRILHHVQLSSLSLRSIDVHPCGDYVLVGVRSPNCLAILDSQLRPNYVYPVDMVRRNCYAYLLGGAPQEDADLMIRKAFFLPISPNVLSGHLAVCVCCSFNVTLALVETNGRVLWEQSLKASRRMLSFTQCEAKPSILYASLALRFGDGVESTRVARFRLDYNTFTVEEFTVCLKPSPARYCSPLLLLGAGTKFLLALHFNNVVVFDLESHKQVAFFESFSDMFSVDRLLGSEEGQSSILAVEKRWLDGLTPDSMGSDRPVVVMVVCHPHSGSVVIKSLRWSMQEALDDFNASSCQGGNECETGKVVEGADSCSVAGEEAGKPRNGQNSAPVGIWRNAFRFAQISVKSASSLESV